MTHIPDPHPPEEPELDPTSAVLTEIAAERDRQIRQEGWTEKHDDGHRSGQLALAASCYAKASVMSRSLALYEPHPVPGHWPWAASWWKPTTPRRDLVKAAALIVAEIERLDRAESS